MTVTFVGAQGNAGTTVTIPTHQSGDLILLFAYRDGSTTAPTTPTAGGTVPTWTLIGSTGGNLNSSNFRYAVATGSTTTSGTWTNATELICLVYRGTRVVGASAGGGAASTSIAYPALTLQRTDNSSWVVGVAGHRSATNVQVAPTGMTNRVFTGTEAAGHDTNGTVSSWSQQTVTVDANSGWRSWTVELRDATVVVIGAAQAFTATGQAATLTKTVPPKVVAGAVGSFALSGQTAGTVVSRRLVSAVGAFTTAGQAAALKQTHRLVGDAGSYALIAPEIAFLHTHTLVGEAGAVTLSGQSATLDYLRHIDPDPGELALSGYSAAAAYRRRQVLVF